MASRNALITFVLLLTCNLVMAIEEPGFTVVHETDEYEVRRYEPYIVAEVDVEGDFGSSGNRAFRILASYIFGDNVGSEKMQMTAPVESRLLDQTDLNDTGDGTKMAMTAPVISSKNDDKTYTYAFVMEGKYTMDTLPAPTNDQIRIIRQEPRVMAVREYSGRWTESSYRENETTLLRALTRDEVKPVGETVFARYNAPFTPWFMRRNEVMIEIDPSGHNLAESGHPEIQIAGGVDR